LRAAPLDAKRRCVAEGRLDGIERRCALIAKIERGMLVNNLLKISLGAPPSRILDESDEIVDVA
jgi:hypothetical protein